MQFLNFWRRFSYLPPSSSNANHYFCCPNCRSCLQYANGHFVNERPAAARVAGAAEEATTFTEHPPDGNWRVKSCWSLVAHPMEMDSSRATEAPTVPHTDFLSNCLTLCRAASLPGCKPACLAEWLGLFLRNEMKLKWMFYKPSPAREKETLYYSRSYKQARAIKLL